MAFYKRPMSVVNISLRAIRPHSAWDPRSLQCIRNCPLNFVIFKIYWVKTLDVYCNNNNNRTDNNRKFALKNINNQIYYI